MATQIHAASYNGGISPGLALALAGYLAEQGIKSSLLRMVGTVETSANLPAAADHANGDAFLAEDTDHIWVRIDGPDWADIGTMQAQVSDAAVAPIVENPGSDTRTALDGLYVGLGDEVTQSTPTDQRAYRVLSPTWQAARPFGDVNKDGLFYVSNFVDNSGKETVGGVHQSYTKVFGAHVTKNGDGNLDAFWASIKHNGPDEVGIFIGDATTYEGGNVWGIHVEVHAENAEANMYGSRVEIFNDVTGSSKVKIGQLIRSKGDYPGTVGLQISGSGGWTDYLVLRNTDDLAVFSVRGSDGLVSTRSILAAGTIIAASSTDGAQIVRLQTDRPWAFRQSGTGGATALRLSPDASEKEFSVTSPGGNAPLKVFVSDTAGTNALTLGNTGGKIGFYGGATTLKPTGVPVDAAGIHAALVTLGLIGA